MTWWKEQTRFLTPSGLAEFGSKKNEEVKNPTWILSESCFGYCNNHNQTNNNIDWIETQPDNWYYGLNFDAFQFHRVVPLLMFLSLSFCVLHYCYYCYFIIPEWKTWSSKPIKQSASYMLFGKQRFSSHTVWMKKWHAMHCYSKSWVLGRCFTNFMLLMNFVVLKYTIS